MTFPGREKEARAASPFVSTLSNHPGSAPHARRTLLLGYGLAGAVVLLASLVVSPNWRGAFGVGLGWIMLAIAWSDSQRYIVPDILSGGALALGIVNAIVGNPEGGFDDVLMALARATLAAGLFLFVRVVYRRIRRREGLGLGDVKLAAAAGAWLSPPMLPVVIEIAAVTGLAAYLVRQKLRRRAVRATSRLPFGAFFALAIWFGWILDTQFVQPG